MENKAEVYTFEQTLILLSYIHKLIYMMYINNIETSYFHRKPKQSIR